MAILAYHKVDNKFELGLTNVKPEMFARQVFYLKECGIDLSPSLEEAVANTGAAYLTFDDGYDCFYRNVVPVLLSAKAKATVFVISDYIGKENKWDLRLSYKPFRHMSAAQLREVATLGFQIGSHSSSHRDLTRLERGMARDELRNSKMEIEDLIGREVSEISFPFGRYDCASVEMAREAGYKRLYGLGSTGSYGVLARVPVYRIDTAAAVRRKVEMNRYEIIKSDFVHSFAGVSALISIKNRGKTAQEKEKQK
jgi:peptidoglycan/xylan/chitin deacetylase (PgdA/CDA1 family)